MTLGELVFRCNDNVNIYVYQQTDNPEVTQKLYEGGINSLRNFDYEFYARELGMRVLLWYTKTDFLGVTTLYANVY